MRKILILLCIGFALSSATEDKHKWILDVGANFATYASLFSSDEEDGSSNFTGVNFGTRYQLAKMVEVGIATGYEYYSSANDPAEGSHGSVIDNHLIHIAAEGKFDWITFFDHLQLYSRLGAGVTLNYHNNSRYDTEVEPVLQGTLAGIEYINTVGCYVEFGAGYRGFFSGGLSVRF